LAGGVVGKSMAARIGKSPVSTPFDQAWSLLKAVDYGLLASLASDSDRDRYSRILREAMRDITNRPTYPTARTPSVFRSMSKDEPELKIGDKYPKRYFSPQRITAQQYSEAWRDPAKPRRIGRFEMPVSFNDDSVLNLGRRAFDHGGPLNDIESPVVQRLAEGSNISPASAMERAQQLESAYTSSPGHMRMNNLNELLANAGVDYVLHPERSSRISRPPVWQRFNEKLDSAARQVPELNKLNQAIMAQMGDTPYLSAWHVGDEESAPVFMGDEPEYDEATQRMMFGDRNTVSRNIDNRLFDWQDKVAVT